LRALALVVALLWASIGSAGAQQTGASTPGASNPGAAGAPGGGQPAAQPAGAASATAPIGALPADGSDQSIDAQAAALLKKLTAHQFDGRLPEQPLPDWLAQQIGKRANVQWTTGDCTDEGGEPDSGQGGDGSGGADGSGGGNADAALCSEAQALFFDANGKPSLDRYVVLQLRVGNRRLGITDDPGSCGPDALTIFVFDGSSNRTLTRLGDLPGALTGMN
jgi:hypothetical protein